jgi:dTDP-glucose pyrophosphorylase
MKDWKKTLIGPSTPILEAMRIIDDSSLQIAMVVNEKGRLIGVVTDGDIRHGIIKGIALESPVDGIMNRTFTCVESQATRDEILKLMKHKELRQIPVVDEQGFVIDLKIITDLIQAEENENWVVLMAGGIGERLQPLTNDCPKPLIKIGNKPIMETILESFVDFGFRNIFVSVNYKSEMIIKYFQDGSKWGANINYLVERTRMGTAGALGLLPYTPKSPLIVMNADILTKVNFLHLLDFHNSHEAMATMCVRDYRFQCPYGVVRTDKHFFVDIDEKPVQNFFVNAGIYVLDPLVLDYIPANTYFDMTTLFKRIIERNHETVVFPIREYWIDVGRREDYSQANGDFPEVFG